MSDWNNPFMEQALRLAASAHHRGEVPIGAVIVHAPSQEIIASAHNQTIRQQDPTAHAEMLAIRAACEKLKSNYLNECELYVTLEPCAMCAQAIAHAKVGKLIYGASDPKGGGVEHGATVFQQPTCHHQPEVVSGIGAEPAAALLKAFFKAKR